MTIAIKKVNIWGISINPMSKTEFIEVIDNHISSKSENPLHITGVNPETIAHALRNEQLFAAIKDSDLVNIDNVFVLLMMHLSGIHAPERVATPDLFESMLALAEKRKYSVYVLGAKEEILKKAIINIQTQFPHILIAGYQNGYFNKNDIKKVCCQIRESKPDILFLALPTPDKEMFIYNYKRSLGVPVLLGIGGAIDVIAGVIVRAPLFLRKIGLEGVHRAFQSPLNYGKRYITLYPVFIGHVIKEFLKIKNRLPSDNSN